VKGDALQESSGRCALLHHEHLLAYAFQLKREEDRECGNVESQESFYLIDCV